MPEIEEPTRPMPRAVHRFAVGEVVTVHRRGSGIGEDGIGREVRITELGLYKSEYYEEDHDIKHRYQLGYRGVYLDEDGDVDDTLTNDGYGDFVGEMSFVPEPEIGDDQYYYQEEEVCFEV